MVFVWMLGLALNCGPASCYPSVHLAVVNPWLECALSTNPRVLFGIVAMNS